MSYTITTIEKHENALKCSQEVASNRLERQVDVGDGAASSWATGTSISFHKFAIELLKNGLEHLNQEIPCQEFSILVNEQDEIVSDSTFIDSYGKLQWELSKEQRDEFGRYAIPYNDNNRSRVHKSLNLRQVRTWIEAKRTVKSHCACAGAGVSFHAIPA